MAQVLFPAYFPFDPGYPCFSLDGWGGLDLTQAMFAYWKVRSWTISISAGAGGSASGSLNVSSPDFGAPALIETDLVCPGQRGCFFTPGGDAEDGNFAIGNGGWGFALDFREFSSMGFPPFLGAPASFPVTITGLQDEPIILSGGCAENLGDGVSAIIAATSFWPYEL